VAKRKSLIGSNASDGQICRNFPGAAQWSKLAARRFAFPQFGNGSGLEKLT
jgi:hypothetical protein